MLVKYNVNRLKPGRRNEWRQTLAEEIEKNIGSVKGSRGWWPWTAQATGRRASS